MAAAQSQSKPAGESGAQDAATRATAANYYISRFYQLARSHGLNAEEMLDRAGIDPGIINSPRRRINAEKLGAFVVEIWDELQDESMELAESPIPRGAFYMMGRLTINEPTLRKALEQIVRFYGLVTQAFILNLNVGRHTATLTAEMHSPEMDPDHLLAEINIMGWHRYSAWLIAQNIPLKTVYFSYPMPPHVKEYSFLFPGKHVFDAPFMGFEFSKKFLDYRNVQNLGSLKSFMRRCPVELFLQPKTDFTLSSEIRTLLNQCRNGEYPSIDAAAGQVNMSRRTLIRKLKDEGTSFQQIKDVVRRDRAMSLLTRQTLSVGEIADRLGFSDPSVFARAFKSWTGQSPREYRAGFT